jgi:hypothetical protein
MPPQTTPPPSDLNDWVATAHPRYKARFIKAEYVLCDAWNGTVYVFNLRIPLAPASGMIIYVFTLDQSDQPSKWISEFQGPKTPSAKSAVLRALRSPN